MAKPVTRSKTAAAIDKVIAGVNKSFKKPVIARADDVRNVYHLRRPSGIMQLDIDTGGGLPSATAHMLSGPDGAGKCLGLGTLVMRHDGILKKVEDIQVGESLMGPDSAPRRVMSVTRNRGQLFRIVPKKGDSWICNDVHVLTLVESCSGKVIDIPLDEYLKTSAYFKNEHKLFQPEGGVDFPVCEDPRIDPYFIGVWLGDGNKDLRSLRISKPDAEIFQLCKDIAKDWGLRVEVDSHKSCPTYRIVGTRGPGTNPLLTRMQEMFLEGIAIPPEYLLGSRQTREQVLAGLLDTDGHLARGSYFEIVQKNAHLAENIAYLARSLGLRARVREKVVNGSSYWRITLMGDATFLPMRIQRKMPTKVKFAKNAVRVGFHVEAIGEGEYAGFTLDGDGRFLLGDFTVTHNTDLLYRYMAQQQRYYEADCWNVLACVEHPVDHLRLRKVGINIAMPQSLITAKQVERKRLGLEPFTAEQVKELRTGTGEFTLIHGETMEDTLEIILHVLEVGRKQGRVPNIVGVDSVSALAPKDTLDKDFDEELRRGVHAKLLTTFFNKYFPLVTGLAEEPIDTTLIMTQQVRANAAKAAAPTYMAKWMPDYAIGGAWAAKHGKLMDIMLTGSTKIREKKTTDGKESKEVVGKMMHWEIAKGKAGTHEGVHGEVEFNFKAPTNIDYARTVMVAGIKYGVLSERDSHLTWLRDGKKQETVNKMHYATFLAKLQGDRELDYLIRQDILRVNGIECTY